jgi:hypothetical protein
MDYLARSIAKYVQKITGVAEIAGDIFLIAAAGSLFSVYPNIWLQAAGISCLTANLIWLVWGDRAERLTAPLYTLLGLGIIASGCDLFGLSGRSSSEEILTGCIAALAGLLYGYGDFLLAHVAPRWRLGMNGHQLSHILYIPAIGGLFIDGLQQHSITLFLSAISYAIGNAGYYVVDYRARVTAALAG